MKILIQCPYCDNTEFEVEHDNFICDTCGEIVYPEELNYKKLEEN